MIYFSITNICDLGFVSNLFKYLSSSERKFWKFVALSKILATNLVCFDQKLLNPKINHFTQTVSNVQFKYLLCYWKYPNEGKPYGKFQL